MQAGVGYYCVFCHLSVTLSHAGGYALVLQDDENCRRVPSRIPLDLIRPSAP